MKQPALNKPMEQMKAEQVLLFECLEERGPSPRGHQYDNGIRMRQPAVPADLQTFAHLYDLPVSRAKIFSVLHKKKTAGGKKWQKACVWQVNFSEYKFNKPKAQSLKPKTF